MFGQPPAGSHYGAAPPPAYGAPPPAAGYAPPPAYAPAAPLPKKKALLIGCGYPGTSAQLNGCLNDVGARMGGVGGGVCKPYFCLLRPCATSQLLTLPSAAALAQVEVC